MKTTFLLLAFVFVVRITIYAEKPDEKKDDKSLVSAKNATLETHLSNSKKLGFISYLQTVKELSENFIVWSENEYSNRNTARLEKLADISSIKNKEINMLKKLGTNLNITKQKDIDSIMLLSKINLKEKQAQIDFVKKQAQIDSIKIHDQISSIENQALLDSLKIISYSNPINPNYKIYYQKIDDSIRCVNKENYAFLKYQTSLLINQFSADIVDKNGMSKYRKINNCMKQNTDLKACLSIYKDLLAKIDNSFIKGYSKYPDNDLAMQKEAFITIAGLQAIFTLAGISPYSVYKDIKESKAKKRTTIVSYMKEMQLNTISKLTSSTASTQSQSTSGKTN